MRLIKDLTDLSLVGQCPIRLRDWPSGLYFIPKYIATSDVVYDSSEPCYKMYGTTIYNREVIAEPIVSYWIFMNNIWETSL